MQNRSYFWPPSSAAWRTGVHWRVQTYCWPWRRRGPIVGHAPLTHALWAVYEVLLLPRRAVPCHPGGVEQYTKVFPRLPRPALQHIFLLLLRLPPVGTGVNQTSASAHTSKTTRNVWRTLPALERASQVRLSAVVAAATMPESAPPKALVLRGGQTSFTRPTLAPGLYGSNAERPRPTHDGGHPPRHRRKNAACAGTVRIRAPSSSWFPDFSLFLLVAARLHMLEECVVLCCDVNPFYRIKQPHLQRPTVRSPNEWRAKKLPSNGLYWYTRAAQGIRTGSPRRGLIRSRRPPAKRKTILMSSKAALQPLKPACHHDAPAGAVSFFRQAAVPCGMRRIRCPALHN